MQLNFSQLNRQQISQFRSIKIRFSATDPSERSFSFKLPGGLSLTGNLNLKDFDLNVVQGKLNSLLSKTHSFINEVRSPLVKTKKPLPEEDFNPNYGDEALVTKQTIRGETPNGKLSLAAIISIEQFSRFFLRDNSDIHVHLKENPYEENLNTNSQDNASEMASLKEIMKSKIVGKEAFIRIAPAVSGVADRPTGHNLFKVLTRDGRGHFLQHLVVIYSGNTASS